MVLGPSSRKLPEQNRLRPRELFFVFLGTTTGAALAVFWFRLVPEALAQKGMTVADLDGLARFLCHMGFQIPLLVVAAVILAAGLATRASSGKDTATWILAGGSLLIFATLAFSLRVLYEPVLGDGVPATSEDAEATPPDDDWQD
ncbi:hypothetical protein G6O69_34870 [Pseudenhygromyxa sp. WMMC2535]|uniref:hypothetical protein n=1 Tax=Pseudenhygromyxa sp. WMMC2535 TaxID=2712867 RepID=UPI0015552A45|nr:hypothetical protein [Pseudenhygromyxa sp. WMMC2535]NVB43058.1 hypothetical protein [Pseudenhygromyxa sp. WMMC2535]